MTSFAGSSRRLSPLWLGATLVVGLLAAGCAGQGSAEQVSSPVLIGMKNANLLIENRAGETLNDVRLTVVPFGKNEYSKLLSSLAVGERREVPLSDLSAADGTKFIPMLSRPKTVRLTARNRSGKQYDIEQPWR